MGLTDLTIRLLLLFLPGIVCFLIVERLIVHGERKTHEVLFFSYVYGVLSYLIYWFFLVLAGIRWSSEAGLHLVDGLEPVVLRSVLDSKVELNFAEIGFVTVAGVALAFVVSFIHNKKLLHKLAHRLKVTNKYGDPDVWNYAFNLDDARWCVVRDASSNKMFQGYIQAFSDVGDTMEVFLTQVVVYNEQTSETLYSADRMYLARKKGELTIEFQNLPEGKEKGNGQPNAPENRDQGLGAPT